MVKNTLRILVVITVFALLLLPGEVAAPPSLENPDPVPLGDICNTVGGTPAPSNVPENLQEYYNQICENTY